MQGLKWEPWTPLGLEMPLNQYEGFNPKNLKKNYRNLAKQWHPDKVSAEVDPDEAKQKWEDIQRAHETLSDKTKFDNWMTYGSPEGSAMSRSMDIALPSFLKDEANQIYVLAGFFVSIVMVPIVIILKLKDNDENDNYFANGIHKYSVGVVTIAMFQALEKNMKKKQKQFTDDQWIEIMENAGEIRQINTDLAKKNNVRDMIRMIIKGLAVSEKFDDAVKKIDDIIPRLTTVLAMNMSNVKFTKELAKFNATQDTKVQYTTGMLFEQLIKFTDKVIQNKKNGYKGYELQYKQVELTQEQKTDLQKDENPDFKKITLRLQIQINHLDLKSIKETESEEIYNNYWKSLGLFVSIENDEKLSLVYQLDQIKDLKDADTGLIESKIDINVKNEGKYNFKLIFADNFGFLKESKITLEAKE